MNPRPTDSRPAPYHSATLPPLRGLELRGEDLRQHLVLSEKVRVKSWPVGKLCPVVVVNNGNNCYVASIQLCCRQ